jgi:hypothetical protein
VHHITEPSFEKLLNDHGADGWDLCASFDRERGGNSKEVFLIFKREAATS